jgi:hypothetical protein
MILLSAVTVAAWPQTVPDLSGLWKQDSDRCRPKRSGDVTLHIEHHDSELTVETSISHGSQIFRHAVQKYTTDGKVSVSTGGDGDEFHTSVVWKDSSLVFAIEEHEDGRILHSQDVVTHREWRNAPKDARTPKWRETDSLLSSLAAAALQYSQECELYRTPEARGVTGTPQHLCVRGFRRGKRAKDERGTAQLN